jgi:Mrp family chromosome partitioning ATPase
LKLMSYGWSRHGKAAVLRGPLVSGLVTQLATNTAWGNLDVLLIDMPPGTGDIHIKVCCFHL